METELKALAGKCVIVVVGRQSFIGTLSHGLWNTEDGAEAEGAALLDDDFYCLSENTDVNFGTEHVSGVYYHKKQSTDLPSAVIVLSVE